MANEPYKQYDVLKKIQRKEAELGHKEKVEAIEKTIQYLEGRYPVMTQARWLLIKSMYEEHFGKETDTNDNQL